jgi:hypothetical protein
LITEADIENYHRHNKLADDVCRMAGIRDRESGTAYKHKSALAEQIAEAEAEMSDIDSEMTKQHGVHWAARCVEHMLSKPDVFQVMVERLSGDQELTDTQKIVIGFGGQAFEIRRAKRGMDGL